jgi:hypothetical protein
MFPCAPCDAVFTTSDAFAAHKSSTEHSLKLIRADVEHQHAGIVKKGWKQY